jgi:hypothetical protein
MAAWSVLTRPNESWRAIADDPSLTTRRLITGYLARLLAVVPVCGAIANRSDYAPLSAIPSTALTVYLVLLITILALAASMRFCAPLFGGVSSFNHALRLITFGGAPAYLLLVFSVIPGLRPLGLASLVSLYALYQGAPFVMKVDRQKCLALGATTIGALAAFLLFAYSSLTRLAREEESSTAVAAGPVSTGQRNIFGFTPDEVERNSREYERIVAEQDAEREENERRLHDEQCLSMRSAATLSSNPDEAEGWATSAMVSGC